MTREAMHGPGPMPRAPLKSQTLALLRERHIPVGTILDVGVQHGTPELIAAYPDRTHILFEPVASYRAAIEKTYAGISHQIVEAAVSDSVGTTELVTISAMPGLDVSHAWMAGAHEKGKGHPVVPMITLDHFLEQTPVPAPYFLKIDVDGYEPWVLRGATRTLASTSIVMIETPWDSIAERLATLNAAGFRLMDLCEPCYYDGALHQVDAVLIRTDLYSGHFADIHRAFDAGKYSIFS